MARRILMSIVMSVTATSMLVPQGQEEGRRTYVGAGNCRMCHVDEHKSWQTKSHARAYDLLVAVQQEKNEKCLRCHTTGYGEGGFVDADKTPDLRGVTCESCHGPGGAHNGDAAKIEKTPSGAVCGGCHMAADIH